mmetsp:Transcript_27299/g.31798  ORF Transcript_27299/g.31798 Transcript_27299/m.31798 type:complete len:1305 (+) Transcript_27299:116-4030(+)
MTEITTELIDALLCPTSNTNAEKHYKSIPIPTRIKSLLSLLQSLPLSTITANYDDISRSMLIAVLLRKEVSSLAGYSVQNVKFVSEWEIVRILGEMTNPLLHVFETCNCSSSNVKRQIGFVIAEVCSSLSVMEEGISIHVMNLVLERIANECSKTDKASLYLLSSLAQRSPLTLIDAKGKELPIILQNAISNLQSTTNPNNITEALQSVQIIIETLLYISIASDKPSSSSPTTASSPTTTATPLSNQTNPKERLVQLIQIQTMTENNPKKLSISTTSNAASFGIACLDPLLKFILSIVTKTATTLSNNPKNHEILQSIMQTLSQCASTCPSLLAGNLDVFTNVCRTFLFIASSSSSSLSSSSSSMYNDETEIMMKLSALEALVTLCMVPDVSNVLLENEMIRNLCLLGEDGSGKGGVVGVCANFIVKGVDEDVDEWAMEDVALQDDTQWENDDIAIFAESILDSFLKNGGGGSLSLSFVLSVVESFLASNNWQELRAGLAILESCLTSSPFAFVPHVSVALEAALNFTSHPCVRVQYQAIQLLAALCQADNISVESRGCGISSRPILDLRKQHGKRILQSIAQLMSSKCCKVLSHACLAIVSYCRGGNGKENAGVAIDKSLVLPYFGDILNAITCGPLSLDIASAAVVFIRAFGSIACLADVAENEFASYYGTIMPGLLECASFGLDRDQSGLISASGSTTHDIVALRGAAIEAATIVGQSIEESDSLFHPDAQNIMQMILPLLQNHAVNQSAPTLVPIDQILAASARIARVIGAAYAPFLPSVLPHLLKVANEKVDISITDGDADATGMENEYDEDTGTESITLALPGMGVKKFVLNTTQIQEKSNAARAIYEHANAMGSCFGPYANECFEAFLPLLDFKYSAEVRATAAQALGPIFDSACEFSLSPDAKDRHSNLPAEVYPRILLSLAKQLKLEDEDDIETLSEFSEAMSNICYSAYTHKNEADGSHVASLTGSEVDQFVSELLKVIGSCLNRRTENIAASIRNALNEDQKADIEEILVVEAELLSGLVDSLGYNMKILKGDFVPVFDKYILHAFGPLLTATGTSDSRARFAAVCLFDDCIEHCGSIAAAKYAPHLIKGISQGLNDATNGGDIDLKEAAVYGVSQIARHAPKEALASVIVPLIQQLIVIAKEGEVKQKDDIEFLRLVENSTSALATLVLFQSSPYPNLNGVNKSDVINIFVSNLPLSEDEDEAKFCHKGFVELIESGEIDITSKTGLIMNIIGQIAAAVSDNEEIATRETCMRMAMILGEIQQQIDPATLESVYSSLSPEAQSGINTLMGTS